MDTVIDFTLSTGLKLAAVFVAFAFLVHVVPFIFDTSGLGQYPGPLLAKLSDTWLGWHTAHGRINQAVWNAHQAYGPIVRIAPNHVSVADVSALQQIYGHSTGILKAELYDAFVTFNRASVFSTRSREVHARKRKILAHTFSQKTTLEFEPVVRQYLGGMIKQWDHMCAAALVGKGGVIGEMPWKNQGGRAEFDTLKWYNFMVFDIIGDLVFRAPFSMTERGTDMARIVKSPDQAMASYESIDTKLEYDTINAIEAVNARSAFIITLAVLPALWRPLIKKLPLPWIHAGTEAFQKISKLTVTAVADRPRYSANRNDIFAKYFEATDENGQKLDPQELSSEAITLLIAGTDTTSNSVAAMTFYLAHNLIAQAKLQAELDEALGTPRVDSAEELVLATYEQIKSLPYLQDVVNEGLRVFSTVGLGLPRTVPDGGITVLGRTFSPGTVVSVPTYVLNRDRSIWGEDAESFNPDRWTNGNKAAMSKAFAPFSIGPRACIGRNLATMELLLVVANVFHRYEIVPAHSEPTMKVQEGFLRKPLKATVLLKRRGAM